MDKLVSKITSMKVIVQAVVDAKIFRNAKRFGKENKVLSGVHNQHRKGSLFLCVHGFCFVVARV